MFALDFSPIRPESKGLRYAGLLLGLSLYHIAGLGTALAFLHAGAVNAVLPRFEAATAAALIERHGAVSRRGRGVAQVVP